MRDSQFVEIRLINNNIKIMMMIAITPVVVSVQVTVKNFFKNITVLRVAKSQSGASSFLYIDAEIKKKLLNCNLTDKEWLKRDPHSSEIVIILLILGLRPCNAKYSRHKFCTAQDHRH